MIMLLILIEKLMKKYRIVLRWNWCYRAEYNIAWDIWWREFETETSKIKEEVIKSLDKFLLEEEKKRRDREIIEIYPYENKICLNDWMTKVDCSCQGDTCLNDKHQKKGWWIFLNMLKRFFE